MTTHVATAGWARAALRARGALDPARHGTEGYEPLKVDEHLEVLATGEVVTRGYRHPANVDHALEAGATWEQVAARRARPRARRRRGQQIWRQSATSARWRPAESLGSQL
jgi:hypothetical protein